jgi:hypothetical protein
VRPTIIYFRAGAFYDYFMSVAFWMRPFFADFCRYGENRKAVDNERIARNCAGLERMSISAFYALQNQCSGEELANGFQTSHEVHAKWSRQTTGASTS